MRRRRKEKNEELIEKCRKDERKKELGKDEQEGRESGQSV